MSRCGECGQETDVLVPMSVDFGVDVVDEDWCPRCAAELLTEEVYGLDESETTG